MKISAFVIDKGEFYCTSLDGYLQHIAHEIEKAGDELRGISIGLRIAPLFRKALFVVDEKCFITELQTMYIGEDGKSSSIPIAGARTIGEMSIKPIEYREAIRWATLDVERQLEGLTEVFKEDAQRFSNLISLLETIRTDFK